MRILQLHSNYIEYRPVEKEIPSAEECERKAHRLDELVVLFTCVEKGDTAESASKAVDGVKDYLNTIKCNRILIYPYSHLSSDLAKPADALKVLVEMEANAKAQGIEVHRAPFGWCKEFSISIKGHPLAEQFRTEAAGGKETEVVSKALEAEQKIRSHWFIMRPDGEMVPVGEFDFLGHENLKKFADYEISKVRAVQQLSLIHI